MKSVLAVVLSVLAAGQIPGPGGPPVDPESRFEIVSIKPFDRSAQPRMNMTPGRFEFDGLNASGLISLGLRVPPNRLAGLPAWTDVYAISAKAPEGPPPTVSVMNVMIANLVKDRFKLVTHAETREMPVYNLVFARADRRFGPAMKESSAECRAKLLARLEASRRGAPAQLGAADPCTNVKLAPASVDARGSQMPLLASLLTQSVGRTVIDKTGLTSYYDYTLKWTPDPGSRGLLASPDAPPPAPDPDAPDLFTAVQEQLGLKLESARGPVEIVVIDHVEKPVLD